MRDTFIIIVGEYSFLIARLDFMLASELITQESVKAYLFRKNVQISLDRCRSHFRATVGEMVADMYPTCNHSGCWQ